jgi:hypothetical protein
MATDHSANLAKLHSAEADLAAAAADLALLREQVAEARAVETALRAQAEASGAAVAEARAAAETASAAAGRLQADYEVASMELRRKIMLLTAIARMADKGLGGAGGGGRGKDGKVRVNQSARLLSDLVDKPNSQNHPGLDITSPEPLGEVSAHQ